MDSLQLPDIKGSLKIKLIDKETGNVDYEQEVNNAIAPWVQIAMKEALVCQHMGVAGINIFNELLRYVRLGKKVDGIDYLNSERYPRQYSYASRYIATSATTGYATANVLQSLMNNDGVNSKASMLFDFPETVANGQDIDCVFWTSEIGDSGSNRPFITRYPNNDNQNNNTSSSGIYSIVLHQLYQALFDREVFSIPKNIGAYIFSTFFVFREQFAVVLYIDTSSNRRYVVYDIINGTTDFDTYTYTTNAIGHDGTNSYIYLYDGCIRLRYTDGVVKYLIYNVISKTSRFLYAALNNNIRYLPIRDTFIYTGTANSSTYSYSGGVWTIKTYSYISSTGTDGTIVVNANLLDQELVVRNLSGAVMSSHSILEITSYASGTLCISVVYSNPIGVDTSGLPEPQRINIDLDSLDLSPCFIFKSCLNTVYTVYSSAYLSVYKIIKHKDPYVKTTAFATLPSVINKTSAQKIRLEYSFSIPVAVPTYDLL